MNIRCLATLSAGLVFAAVMTACKNTNEPDLPATIDACETNTAEVCGTWRLDGDQYDAVWPQGSAAVIRVQRFDADSVVFTRQDTPGSSSAGMTAVYRGGVRDRSVTFGVVEWTHRAQVYSGSWRATW